MKKITSLFYAFNGNIIVTFSTGPVMVRGKLKILVWVRLQFSVAHIVLMRTFFLSNRKMNLNPWPSDRRDTLHRNNRVIKLLQNNEKITIQQSRIYLYPSGLTWRKINEIRMPTITFLFAELTQKFSLRNSCCELQLCS